MDLIPFSSVLSPVIAKLIPAVRPAVKEEDTADEADPEPTDPTDLEDATERTPLVTPASQSQPKTSRAVALTLLNPILVASVVGLLIGIIKPAQRRIVGNGADDADGSSAWQSIGSGLVMLGAAFAITEILGVGAGIRAGEEKEWVLGGLFDEPS